MLNQKRDLNSGGNRESEVPMEIDVYGMISGIINTPAWGRVSV
jgi:hypothetical protein